jgi:hypothetical protein
MIRINSQFELVNYILLNVKKGMMSQSERDVLVALATHMNKAKRWKAWPSFIRLAEISMTSERIVGQSMTVLKRNGVVRCKKGTNGSHNKYNIMLCALSDLTGVEAVLEGGIEDVTKIIGDTVKKEDVVGEQPNEEEEYDYPL